jgi:hypothetical protein
MTRIVLDVTRDAVRCHCGAKSGPREYRITSDASIGDAVRAALEGVGRRPFRRRRVSVLLAGEWCQVRRLEGLPHVGDVAVTTALVRENWATFFLRSAPSLLVADLFGASDGTIWGAAFEALVVEEVIAAATAAAWRVDCFASAAAPPDAPSEIRHTIDTLAGRQTFALVWRPDASRHASTRGALVVVGCAAVLLSVGAYAAPGVHALAILRAAAVARAPSLGESTDDDASAMQTLAAVDRFDARRTRMTALLLELTRALPESAAIVSLRADSLEVSITVYAAGISDVIQSLHTGRVLGGARLVGSVSRVAGTESALWRATIKGRLRQ